MIKKVTIENFQSHKNTELEFCRGVNIIVGSSDKGKSAILRSLRWNFENQPLGDRFRSKWGGNTKVTVETEDAVVVRGKTKSSNFYRIGQELYTSFNKTIPEPLQNLYNFLPLNFQWQHDSVFLLGNSGGEVARYINELIDLTIIDSSLQSIERIKRSHNKEMEFQHKLLKEKQVELKSYKKLDGLEELVLAAEVLEHELYVNYETLSEMADLIGEIEDCKKQLKVLDKTNKCEGTVSLVGEIYAKMDRIDEQIDERDDFIVDLQLCRTKLEETNKVSVIEECYKAADKLYYAYSDSTEVYFAADSLADAYEICQEEYEEQKNIHKEAVRQLKEIMPDVCPTCGQEIHK